MSNKNSCENINTAVEKRKFTYSIEKFISSFFAAYFLLNILTILIYKTDTFDYTSKLFLQNTDKLPSDAKPLSLVVFAIILLLLMAVFTVLDFFIPKARILPNAIAFSAIGLGFAMVIGANKVPDYYTVTAIIIAVAIAFVYATKNGCFEFLKTDFNNSVMWVIVAVITLVFGFFIAAIGVYRYLSYSTPNFDFGLFCNMFHNMKTTGLPMVTSERDQLLSHFAVHISPIFYVMLPFYAIFSSPVTLQILQAIVVYSGIIPLCILCRQKGLSRKVTIIVSLIYAAYPAISGGCFYDLHENCFYLPLLLFMFCFYEKKNYPLMSAFAVLTLLIKEDAFIYIIFFALYVFFSEKKFKVAIPLAAGSVVYFLFASFLLNRYGTGSLLAARYDNLLPSSDSGIFDAFKVMLLNPGYILTQILEGKDGSTAKLIYLLQLLAPVALMPFATKKISRYILVAPVLLNIITMYKYLPDIGFQYGFGVTAFLFYVTVLNISELKGFPKKFLLQLGCFASVLLFFIIVIPKFTYYQEKYTNNKETFKEMDEILETIPDDASVATSTFLLAHLSDRSEIYELNYHKENKQFKTDTDYVVIDVNSNKNDIKYFEQNGYEKITESNRIVILKKLSNKD